VTISWWAATTVPGKEQAATLVATLGVTLPQLLKLPLPPRLMEWSVMAVATPITLISAIAVVLQTFAQIHTRA